MRKLIAKIVSGGQTGVDRGALEAALEAGFPYGGMIPKGRLAEDGIVPECFDKMEVSARKDYLFRTEWNVVHSDATLIIARGELSGGTKRTEGFCARNALPHMVIVKQDVNGVLEWLNGVKAKIFARTGEDRGVVLNVAGPRESKCPGIQASTRRFITRLIEKDKESK